MDGKLMRLIRVWSLNASISYFYDGLTYIPVVDQNSAPGCPLKDAVNPAPKSST